MPAGLRSRITLALLTGAVGYAALTGGGDQPLDSTIVVFIAGLAALVGVSAADRPGDGPRDPVLLAALLLPVYIVVQLIPLPLSIVEVVSPIRAEVAGALQRIGGAGSWVPLSVSAASTSSNVSRVVGCVLVFALVRQLGRSVVNRWTLVVPILGIGVLEAAAGLSQSAAGGTEQVAGTYFSRNHFAGLLEVLFPLALMYGVECVSRRKRRHELATDDAIKGSVLFAAAAAILGAILLSSSKGGSLSAGASLLVMGALRVTRQVTGWRRWVAIGGLAVVLAGAFVLIIPTPLLERFGSLAEEEPTENRFPIWQDTARLCAAYPWFGVGYGNFYTAFARYQTTGLGLAWTAAHNDHLQLLAELGLIGFVFVAVMIGGSFVRAVREGDDRFVAVGCAGAIAAFALHSFVEFNAYVLANAFTLSWVAGVAASFPAASLVARQRSRTSRIERWPMVTAGGVLLTAWSAAWVVFLTSYHQDPAAEHAFCRVGLCDTDAAYATLQGEERDTQPKRAPLEALQTYVAREPASSDWWGRLGEGLQAAGRTPDARLAFERSIALSPRAPEALIGAADFYLEIGERPRGLELISRSLEAGDIIDDAVFAEMAFRKVSADEVLAHVALDARASRVYLRRLIAATSGETTALWTWMHTKGFVNDRSAIEYAEWLVRRNQPDAAAKAWAAYAGGRRLKGAPEGYPESNPVFNGDFEADPVGGPFDWRIDRRPGVAVAFDADTRHSAARSLRVTFDGTHNVGDVGVEQAVYLVAGQYRLQAHIRTAGVTTDEGVGLRVVFSGAPRPHDVMTERIAGTADWTLVEDTFEVPSGGRLLRVMVGRQPSLKFDQFVRGAVWVDEVRLSRGR